MFRKYLLPLLLISILLPSILAPVRTVHAARRPDLRLLRGTWYGVIQGFAPSRLPLTMLLSEFSPDPDDQTAFLGSGCLWLGNHSSFGPLSSRAVPLGNGEFDLIILSTTVFNGDAVVIRLAGKVYNGGGSIRNDVAIGNWQTAQGQGNWAADHVERRRPKCPSVENLSGISYAADLNQVRHYQGDDIAYQHLDFGIETNIVSTGAIVETPDGDVLHMQPFIDIFTPGADFVTSFRYGAQMEGTPIPGEEYTFTLLDATGDPIAGTTATDVWMGCTITPPHNVNAALMVAMQPDINLAWDPVPLAPGWNPANEVGFYQLSVIDVPEVLGSFFGAEMFTTSHIIPWDDFGGEGPGNPNGINYGQGLGSLPDGNYAIDVGAFSMPTDPLGVGAECHIWDLAEEVFFTKSGEDISFSQGSGEPISDTLIVPAGEPVEIAVMMFSDWPGAEDIFDAVQMALDDYGPVHGFGLQQNQYDAGCDPQAGEDSAYTVIGDAQNAGVVGPFCSSSTEGALPVLEDATMVMVSYASTRPDLPGYGPTVFNRVVAMDPHFDEYWHAQISGLQSVMDWEADFASRFGRAPNDLARYAYDATMVLLAQIDAVGAVDLDGNLVIDRASLATAVRGTSGLPGVTGSISLDPDGNRIIE